MLKQKGLPVMTSGKHDAPRKKAKAAYVCLSIFAVIIVIVAGVLIWWYGDQTVPEIADNVPSPEPSADVADVQESESPEEAVSVAAAADREDGRYYTILVVGYDQVEANTDTIMVARSLQYAL